MADRAWMRRSLLVQSQEVSQALLVKANHDVAIDNGYRCRRHAEAFEIIQRRRVFGYVAPLKPNAMRGEELLDLTAEDSAGLIIDDHGFCHVERPPLSP